MSSEAAKEMSSERAARAAPVAIAQGYDSITGDGLNTALTVSQEAVDAVAIVRYQVCESLEQMMEALEINQSLTVGILGGIFSIDQKLEFVEARELTTHAVSIVVFARNTTGRQTITHAELRDGVMPPQSPEEFADFVQVYGDSYMVSRTTGGEYFGVYSYYSQTQEERRELVSSMEASGIFKPVSLGVGLQVAINNFNSTTKTRYSFDQRVTGIAHPSFPNPEGMIEYALEFPSFELTAPTLIHLETYGYERIPGIGRSFNVVRQNVQWITSSSELRTATRVKNDIKQVVDVYNTYGATVEDDEKLHGAQTRVNARFELVKTIHLAYMENPANPDLQADYGTKINELDAWLLNVGVPSLQFATQTSRFAGPYNSVNEAFDDVGDDVGGLLLKHRRITAFQMTKAAAGGHEGPSESFMSLIVTYMDSSGNAETVQHGFTGSLRSSQLSVPNPASIYKFTSDGPQSMLGLIIYTGQLTIELRNGQTLPFGTLVHPFPNLSSARAVFTTPSKRFVLGFRTSSQLTYWEIIYASFLPCLWSPSIATTT